MGYYLKHSHGKGNMRSMYLRTIYLVPGTWCKSGTYGVEVKIRCKEFLFGSRQVAVRTRTKQYVTRLFVARLAITPSSYLAAMDYRPPRASIKAHCCTAGRSVQRTGAVHLAVELASCRELAGDVMPVLWLDLLLSLSWPKSAFFNINIFILS